MRIISITKISKKNHLKGYVKRTVMITAGVLATLSIALTTAACGNKNIDNNDSITTTIDNSETIKNNLIAQYQSSINDIYNKFTNADTRDNKINYLSDIINDYNDYTVNGTDSGKNIYNEIIDKYKSAILVMRNELTKGYDSAIEENTLSDIDSIDDKEDIDIYRDNLSDLLDTITSESDLVLASNDALSKYENNIGDLISSYEDRINTIEIAEAEAAEAAAERARIAEEEKARAAKNSEVAQANNSSNEENSNNTNNNNSENNTNNSNSNTDWLEDFPEWTKPIAIEYGSSHSYRWWQGEYDGKKQLGALVIDNYYCYREGYGYVGTLEEMING